MELTREQRAAAEACGCALIPATEEQVRRLTMQRRVFCWDGAPVLATRDGGFFETHGTLAALIRRHAAVSAQRGAAAGVAQAHNGAGASGADPAAAAGHRPAQASPPVSPPPTPAADPSPTPEPLSREPAAEAAQPVPPSDAAAPAIDSGTEDTPQAEETGVEGEAVPARPRAARAPRPRRSGQPKAPR
ncbi:MAG: hypothetical protein ICV73_26525 [Acetobacteraceae bacterium]|nr:hypothetical protein [Acetobacteraceae bacterium]